jgi:cystathionine beta-synthase
VTGIGRYLRERNPAIQVIGADPDGSVYSGASPHPYLTEGIGEDFWPTTYDPAACDVVVRVGDRDSMLMARIATAREGILMGESGGTVLWAALQMARDVTDADALFVVVLPDSGRNYLGKLYNDRWLRDNGLLGPYEEVADYDWRGTRADVMLSGDEVPRP